LDAVKAVEDRDDLRCENLSYEGLPGYCKCNNPYVWDLCNEMPMEICECTEMKNSIEFPQPEREVGSILSNSPTVESEPQFTDSKEVSQISQEDPKKDERP